MSQFLLLEPPRSCCSGRCKQKDGDSDCYDPSHDALFCVCFSNLWDSSSLFRRGVFGIFAYRTNFMCASMHGSCFDCNAEPNMF